MKNKGRTAWQTQSSARPIERGGMRRKRSQARENHERWLVSYADFITLLFAFFVVMFASSQGSSAKQVSQAVRSALEEGKFSAAISTALGRGKHEANKKVVVVDATVTQATLPSANQPKADLAKSLTKLQASLGEELKRGKVQVRLDDRGLVISLREAAFFASGDSTLQPSSLSTLEKIAGAVAELPNSLRLEGYTDARPIHNPASAAIGTFLPLAPSPCWNCYKKNSTSAPIAWR